MSKHRSPIIRLHEDVALFREAVNFTAAQTGFSTRLIEQDYFCSVLLAYLTEVKNGPVIFKGGTCLAKVFAGFYRLSEDLDFVIPMPLDSTRGQRRKHIAGIKKALTSIAKALPGFDTINPLRGANNSTQYVGSVSYPSLITEQRGTISIEISLREPLLTPIIDGKACTLLLDPVSGDKLVPEIMVPCISKKEALAEKFRAALTRRDVAIRDFYDLDHAVRKMGLRLQDTELVELVRQKLAVPGTDPLDLGAERQAKLRRQLDSRLRPVLREENFKGFALERAFKTVVEMARLIG